MKIHTQLLAELQPSRTQLIAVSKTKPVSAIQELYDAGQRDFGENRVQELTEKYAQLPKDIRWHLIGHLQRNKVKYIAPFVHLIHSIDSERLLREVNKEAAKNDRVVDVLLQFHIAEEDTKFGFDLSEAQELLRGGVYAALPHVRVCGVMGMATFTDDAAQIQREFAHLRSIFDTLKTEFFPDAAHFRERSMGMSGDYAHAVAAGSTMVRVGSLLFGAR